MKINRTYGILMAACIVVGVVLITMRDLDSKPQESDLDEIPTQEANSVIDPSPIIPNSDVLSETGSITTPAISNRLRINLDAYPQVLDPQKAILPKEIAILNLIYEGLIRLDENMQAVPAAAESWQYNQDATRLVFTLRKGLKYSDGSILNAMRFEMALRRLIDPSTQSEFAWLVDAIRGAPDWHASNPAASGYDAQDFTSQLGLHALDTAGDPCTSYSQLDCLTLELEFSQPAPYFHYIMGLWVSFPVRLDLVVTGDTLWWLQAANRIGNGLYVLEDLEPFVRARFAPNPNYQSSQANTSINPQIEFYFINDPGTVLKAYLNNQLEVVWNLNSGQFANLPSLTQQMLESQTMNIPGACSSMILFGMHPIADNQPSPFSDLKVRQAFVLAFDSQSWLRDIDKGQSIFTGTFIPPGFPGYDPVFQPYAFNIERAKEILDESVYGGTQALNELGLRLKFLDTPTNRARYNWLVDNYRRNLGVELSLEPLDQARYDELLLEKNFNPLLDFQSWCAQIPDPHGWLYDYWKADSKFRPDTGYVNPQLDALLQVASSETNASNRLELYAQTQHFLLTDAPAVFGLVPTNRYLVKPWVKGIFTSPYDNVWPGASFPERISIVP